MAKSMELIFKNFMLDGTGFNFTQDAPFSPSSILAGLVMRLFLECGKQRKISIFKSENSATLNRKELLKLRADIKRLAKIGFDNSLTMDIFPYLPGEPKINLAFEDLPQLNWALHGKQCDKKIRVTEQQIYGYEALCIIDEAMTATLIDGAQEKIINAVAVAGIYLGESKALEIMDSFREKGVNPEIIEAAIRERKSRDSQAAGLANSAKYNPLREYARDLAGRENFPSKRQAAKKIKELVLKKACEIGVRLSEDNAERQIGEWLTGITFSRKRTTTT